MKYSLSGITNSKEYFGGSLEFNINIKLNILCQCHIIEVGQAVMTRGCFEWTETASLREFGL